MQVKPFFKLENSAVFARTGLCLECCSQMDYRPDETSYTGYTLSGAPNIPDVLYPFSERLIAFPGQYKRTPCYVLTETFDECLLQRIHMSDRQDPSIPPVFGPTHIRRSRYIEDHADGDLDGSLYVRLHHESTYLLRGTFIA